jgi:hypothetical protein
MRDDTYIEGHRRIRQRLLRIQKFAAPDSGFPTALSALLACVDEIEGLLPDLTDHFNREERFLRTVTSPFYPADRQNRAEQVIAEHVPLLRELRALLDSGRRVVEDLRAGREAGSLAEALKAYLAASVADLLDHEDRETLLHSGGEPAAGSVRESGS